MRRCFTIDDIEFEKRLTSALYRAAELDYTDTQDETLEHSVLPSLRFQRRMRGLVKSPTRYVKNQRRPIYIRVLRTAAAVLIIFTMTLGAAMAVSPTVRAAVVDFVRSWFEDRTEYKTTPGLLERDWTFGYIPEGFELEAEMENELQVFRVYSNINSERIFIDIGAGQGFIDNEHSVFYQLTINSSLVDVYESISEEYYNIIVIYDDFSGSIINIISSIDIDEIIKIAENIS